MAWIPSQAYSAGDDCALSDYTCPQTEVLLDTVNAGVQPLEATLTDIADGAIVEALTFTGNMVNTANPWAVNEGGTGAATFTDGGILLGATAGALEVTAVGAAGELLYGTAANPAWLAAGALTEILVGAGAAVPVWTTATGTGAPMRGTTPTIITSLLMTNASDLRVATTTDAHEFSQQVYDVDDTTWRDALTFTNANAPSVTLGADVTLAGLGLIDPASGLKSLTPVSGSTTGFAAGFTGANLYGGTYVVTSDSGDLQLPLMAAGMNFTIIVSTAIECVAATNVNDGYMLDGVDTAEDNSVVSTSTSGDIAVYQYYTAADWLITTNGWATE